MEVKKNKISFLILRFSLSLMILYFGVSQILNPQQWTFYVEYNFLENFNLAYLVLINGSVEIFFAILIFLGVHWRISALIMAIHIFLIALTIGFNPMGVRDAALAAGLAALFFWKE